jgi:cytochrome c-type biogenesis protein CcmF
MEKPFINILWIGTLVMALGIGMAITRRVAEAKRPENPNPEQGPSRPQSRPKKQVAKA